MTQVVLPTGIIVILCRGYKTVLRFFPNDVACLEPVVALLVHLDALASPALAAAPADGSGSAAAAVPRLDSGAQSLWEAQASGVGCGAAGVAAGMLAGCVRPQLGWPPMRSPRLLPRAAARFATCVALPPPCHPCAVRPPALALHAGAHPIRHCHCGLIACCGTRSREQHCSSQRHRVRGCSSLPSPGWHHPGAVPALPGQPRQHARDGGGGAGPPADAA